MKTYSIASPHILNLKLIVEKKSGESFEAKEFLDYINVPEAELLTYKEDLGHKLYDALIDAQIELKRIDLTNHEKSISNIPVHWVNSFNDEPSKFKDATDYPHMMPGKRDSDPSQPVPCPENTDYFVSKILKSTCATNEMNGESKIYCPLFETNNFNVAVNLMHGEAIVKGYGRNYKDFARDIDTLCDQKSFHPVRNWIDSAPWDGTDRIKPLLASLQTKTPAMRDLLVTKWLIAGCAALYTPDGVDSQGILILQGEGNIGKSLWFSKLCPLKHAIGSHKLIIDRKDSLMECLKFWIVELAEIEGTFKKSDVADLKAFIDRKNDVYRKLFEKHSANHDRRTILCGTGNDDTPLTDPTGNRKYWPIALTGTVKDWFVDFNFQQLWAQVKEELYDKAVDYHLNDDEQALLKEHNLEFTQIEPMEEKLTNRFIAAKPELGQYNFVKELLNTSKIYEKLYQYGKPTKMDLNQIGRTLRKLTGKAEYDRKNTKSYFLIDLDNPDNQSARQKWLKDQEKDDSSAKNALFDY